MLRNAFASLRVRLILLVLLAILPLLGLFLFMHVTQRVASREYAQRNVFRLIRFATLEQEELIVSTRQLLVSIAQIPSIRDGEMEACPDLFAGLLPQDTFYSALTLANPDGEVVCSAPALSTPVSVSDRAWFKHVLQSRDFVVGEYVVGRVSGKSVMVMAYPVLDASNSVQSVIAIGIDLSWLKQLMATAELPDDTSYTVIDSLGVILAHDPDVEQWVGKPLGGDPLVARILAGGEDGLFEAQGPDGIQRLYVYAPLNDDLSSREYVSIGIPKDVAYAETNSVLVTNLIGLGVVLILVVG